MLEDRDTWSTDKEIVSYKKSRNGGQKFVATHTLIFFSDIGETKFENPLKEPISPIDSYMKGKLNLTIEIEVPLLKFQQSFL